jgi:hypothetical protein
MKLSRLNEHGIQQFSLYLDQLKLAPSTPPPTWLLADGATSNTVSHVEVQERTFASRYAASHYLDGLITSASLEAAERDVGLWAWLSLFYFDQVCPIKDGVRKPGEQARHVPDVQNFQRYYRHLLLGPVAIYRAHIDDPDRARGVLMTRVNAPGDVVEQLASRQELITNHSVMKVVTSLYFDVSTGTPKKGSGGKADGSPRRLADIINQYDLTYDLYSLSADGLLSLLPKEFDRFR